MQTPKLGPVTEVARISHSYLSLLTKLLSPKPHLILRFQFYVSFAHLSFDNYTLTLSTYFIDFLPCQHISKNHGISVIGMLCYGPHNEKALYVNYWSAISKRNFFAISTLTHFFAVLSTIPKAQIGLPNHLNGLAIHARCAHFRHVLADTA